MGKSPSALARNDFIDGRLALYNIRYLQFIRNLGVDKQHLDATTDILLLGTALSSAATSAVRAKTNLALLSAGITGGKVAIDKYFYFDKTIPALILTMEGQRNLILADILRGRAKEISEYPLTNALDDLNRYELASSLLGAISAIQESAAQNDHAATQAIKELELPTLDQIAEKKRLGAALTSLATDNPANLAKINLILTKRKLIITDITDFADAKHILADEFRKDSLINLSLWRDAIVASDTQISR